MQPDDSLAQHRHPFLKNLLEEERRRLTAGNTARQNELRQSISRREAELRDDLGIYRQFELHLDSLPFDRRPPNERQKAVLYAAWEDDQRAELAGWKETLAALQAQPVDGQQIFENAQERLLRLLAAEAREVGLLPRQRIEETAVAALPASGESMTFLELEEWGNNEPKQGALVKPWRMQVPTGDILPVKSWADLITATSDWLVRSRLLTRDSCPVQVGKTSRRYLIYDNPRKPDGRQIKAINVKQLSNGLYLNLRRDTRYIMRVCGPLVEKFGQDPAQFRVWLR